MTLLTPPAFLQAGSYSALLDRIHINTIPTIRDFTLLHRARQGFYPSRVPTYTNPSGMQISVSACAGIIANTFATDAGDYRFSNPSSQSVTLAASSTTQNRIDVVGFQVKDNFYDSSGLNQVVMAVIQGANSAGAPSAPSLPNSFIPVVQCLINANAVTPTSMTSRIQRTALDGTPLQVADATERGALGTAPTGALIDRLDRSWLERWDGTAWRVIGTGIGTSTTDRDAAVTSPINGQLFVTTDTYTMWLRQAGAWTSLPDAPTFQLRQSVAQALVTATFTPILFDTEDEDSHNGHSTSSNTDRYTVVKAGVYAIGGAWSAVPNATGVRIGRLTLNGTAINGAGGEAPNTGAGENAFVATSVPRIRLAVGDIIRLEGWQNSGGNLNTVTTNYLQATLSGNWIHP